MSKVGLSAVVMIRWWLDVLDPVTQGLESRHAAQQFLLRPWPLAFLQSAPERLWVHRLVLYLNRHLIFFRFSLRIPVFLPLAVMAGKFPEGGAKAK